ncbi:competence protein ComEA [Curtobacterium sp. 'Ferrero']|uniref:ComEA family DNA-binding protein n=1 Tax=Curtobacterium sp. 'Ferrero' TaxID=2033654 RepID=UPI000BCF7EFD|nr:ComEA family DNA-binding protein [Curtobacterium sp. 'Ferrero']PCN47226.1 competence protein ComEA [Curtobacterium sp. 'Ferrero']
MSTRFSISPRTAVVIAAAVVVVALVVVLLGARSGVPDGPGTVVVTGAPTADAPSGGPSRAAASVPAATSATPSGPAAVVVYVTGAVRRAGVLSLPVGSRVDAAIERAGGADRDADLGRLNLARVLVDGERVWVPRVGETAPPSVLGPDTGTSAGASGTGSSGGGASGTGGDPGASAAVIDLNSADATALDSLPGIGPALAERIVAWRDEHGPFRAVEDLLEVSGIGDAKFAELRDRVRV